MMSSWNTEQLIADDKRYVWHPFTDMAKWCAPDHEPIVLVEGRGAILRDSRGREYIDGNSSIWTNIHGHNHPRINQAIIEQIDRVAHTSFLGATNPLAVELARQILKFFPPERFGRVFFSDDGSTGVEAALRIVNQYWQLQSSPRSLFVSFQNGYHGDTVGAAALGAATLFRGALSGWMPNVQIVSGLEELQSIPEPENSVAGVIIEPLIQGAGGMKLWPKGMLRELRAWCDATGTPLIADEVMTGFGRTGKMFACQHESVWGDIMILGKGLTGGYLPLALTVISKQLFEPFCKSGDDAVLAYGHSYTGNSLGCAAALASLRIFAEEHVLENLGAKVSLMSEGLDRLFPSLEHWSLGLIGAIRLPSREYAANVCKRAALNGLLTRPLREVVVLMPPLCIEDRQLNVALNTVREAVDFVLNAKT